MRTIKQNLSLNQSGASTVEYLLVLIVVVALGQAVYQLNDSFRDWAQNYYVSYFQCLLETGEVPSLGGDGNQGICSEEYQPFTFAAGRPPNTDKDGDGKTNKGRGNRGGEGSGRGDSSPYVSSRAAGDKGDDANRIAIGGGSRGGGSKFRGKSSGLEGGDEASADSKDKSKIYTGSTDATSFGSTDRGGLISAGVRKRNQDQFSGGYGEEERGRERASLGKTDDKSSSDGAGDKEELMKVERKPAQNMQVDDDEGMTIGKFIRFMIIAAIVIALFMLLLGQFLQISKSME